MSHHDSLDVSCFFVDLLFAHTSHLVFQDHHCLPLSLVTCDSFTAVFTIYCISLYDLWAPLIPHSFSRWQGEQISSHYSLFGNLSSATEHYLPHSKAEIML